jgi:hypothetical protein
MTEAEFMTPTGWDAYCHAIAVVDESDRLMVDAAERYARACDMAAYVRQEWERLERPTTVTHRNGTTGPHPLMRLMASWESDARRYWQTLRPRPRIGRPSFSDGLIRTARLGDRAGKPPEPPRVTYGSGGAA